MASTRNPSSTTDSQFPFLPELAHLKTASLPAYTHPAPLTIQDVVPPSFAAGSQISCWLYRMSYEYGSSALASIGPGTITLMGPFYFSFPATAPLSASSQPHPSSYSTPIHSLLPCTTTTSTTTIAAATTATKTTAISACKKLKTTTPQPKRCTSLPTPCPATAPPCYRHGDDFINGGDNGNTQAFSGGTVPGTSSSPTAAPIPRHRQHQTQPSPPSNRSSPATASFRFSRPESFVIIEEGGEEVFLPLSSSFAVLGCQSYEGHVLLPNSLATAVSPSMSSSLSLSLSPSPSPSSGPRNTKYDFPAEPLVPRSPATLLQQLDLTSESTKFDGHGPRSASPNLGFLMVYPDSASQEVRRGQEHPLPRIFVPDDSDLDTNSDTKSNAATNSDISCSFPVTIDSYSSTKKPSTATDNTNSPMSCDFELLGRSSCSIDSLSSLLTNSFANACPPDLNCDDSDSDLFEMDTSSPKPTSPIANDTAPLSCIPPQPQPQQQEQQEHHQPIATGLVSHSTDFLDIWRSVFWFTYRTGLDFIVRSDSGWGCMHRTGQMLLAQAFRQCLFGSSFKIPFSKAISDPVYACAFRRRYRLLLAFFEDAPHAPFSLQNICRVGVERLKMRVGDWFSPSTVANIFNILNSAIPNISPVNIRVAENSTVMIDDLMQVMSTSSKPLVLLVPIRLGTAAVHESYAAKLTSLFTWHQFIGIAGGKRGTSLYFVGTWWRGRFLASQLPYSSAPASPQIKAPLTQYDGTRNYLHTPTPAPAPGSKPKQPKNRTVGPHVASPANGSGNGKNNGKNASSSSSESAEAAWSRTVYRKTDLLYLDPHYPQQYRKPTWDSKCASHDKMYHSDSVRSLPMREMDPSMLLGFLFRTASDLRDFVDRTSEWDTAPLFTVVEEYVWPEMCRHSSPLPSPSPSPSPTMTTTPQPQPPCPILPDAQSNCARAAATVVEPVVGPETRTVTAIPKRVPPRAPPVECQASSSVTSTKTTAKATPTSTSKSTSTSTPNTRASGKQICFTATVGQQTDAIPPRQSAPVHVAAQARTRAAKSSYFSTFGGFFFRGGSNSNSNSQNRLSGGQDQK